MVEAPEGRRCAWVVVEWIVIRQGDPLARRKSRNNRKSRNSRNSRKSRESRNHARSRNHLPRILHALTICLSLPFCEGGHQAHPSSN